jgi:hypothetical protein
VLCLRPPHANNESVPPDNLEAAPGLKTIYDFEQLRKETFLLDTQCMPASSLLSHLVDSNRPHADTARQLHFKTRSWRRAEIRTPEQVRCIVCLIYRCRGGLRDSQWSQLDCKLARLFAEDILTMRNDRIPKKLTASSASFVTTSTDSASVSLLPTMHNAMPLKLH